MWLYQTARWLGQCALWPFDLFSNGLQNIKHSTDMMTQNKEQYLSLQADCAQWNRPVITTGALWLLRCLFNNSESGQGNCALKAKTLSFLIIWPGDEKTSTFGRDVDWKWHYTQDICDFLLVADNEKKVVLDQVEVQRTQIGTWWRLWQRDWSRRQFLLEKSLIILLIQTFSVL